MPTYEYACKSCGEHLEVVQSFKDEALDTCPGCGGPLRKVFGSIGIAFKGSGFYRNDSRSSTGTRRTGDSSPAASESSGSSASSDGSSGSSSGSGSAGSSSGSSGSSSGSGSSGSSSGSAGSGSGSPSTAPRAAAS